MTKGESEIESKHISGAFAFRRNLFFKKSIKTETKVTKNVGASK